MQSSSFSWLVLCILGLCIVNVQWSRTSDGILTIFIFGDTNLCRADPTPTPRYRLLQCYLTYTYSTWKQYWPPHRIHPALRWWDWHWRRRHTQPPINTLSFSCLWFSRPLEIWKRNPEKKLYFHDPKLYLNGTAICYLLLMAQRAPLLMDGLTNQCRVFVAKCTDLKM